MKTLKKLYVPAFWGLVILLTLAVIPALQADNRGSRENPISFTQQDSMDSLRLKIEAMQEVIRRNGDTFDVGINSAMQYPLEQLCTINPDLIPADTYLYENSEPGSLSTTALPSYYIGYYSPVKNTGACGAGWAFVTTGVFEGIIKKKNGITVDLSEQYLIDCNTSGYNCSGGWFCHYMHMSPYGARLESCYPYTGTQGPCNPNNCPWVYQISSWGYVGNSYSVPTTSAIKQKIYDYGSVAACVYADSYFQAYVSGCFSRNSSGSVNHMIILVGWDDSRCITGAWRLKNGWGTAWGESGFMWIKYGVQKVGYAANYVVYP